MTSYPSDEARAELDRLIDLVTSSHEPLLINGEHASAVLVSEED